MRRAGIVFSSIVFPLSLLLAGGVAGQAATSRKDIPSIAKAADGAIVTIVMANGDKPIARGTGFLVSADGVIVTNYHVIENGNVAIVKFPDDTAYPVDGVLAADKVRDLAIIKIHGKTFRTLALGDSDEIQVGEEVVAIGNPLSLESTVSNGIISGVRTSKQQGGKFLQTTAPISPGSSGGPLFNMRGEVVGINTMYLEGGENLNFAIPVNDAKRLLQNQSVKFQQLPNEREANAPKGDAPRPIAPTEEPADSASPRQRECGHKAEQFIRYEGQKPDRTIEAYSVHYDAKADRCYVEDEFTVSYNGEITKLTGVRSWSYYAIHDAFFEGDGGPEYGEFVLRRNGISVKGGLCSIWPDGWTYGKGNEDFGRTKCRSEEEFNELTIKHFGVAPPLHQTSSSRQPIPLQGPKSSGQTDGCLGSNWTHLDAKFEGFLHLVNEPDKCQNRFKDPALSAQETTADI